MLYFTHHRKKQQMNNQALIAWMDELDDMIELLTDNLNELRKDLEDLTDFVEDNLD
jgi:hypothetical protein